MEKIKQAARRKFHFIYKTTNLINEKYYIGMHSTDNLNDGYLGSGTKLSRSIKKHGKNNHSIEILEHFQDRESLKKRERELVNEDILIDPMCMNLALGGGYQWPLSQTPKAKLSRKEALKQFWSSDIGIIAKVKISYRVTGTTRSIESKLKSSKSAKARMQRMKDSDEWEKVKEKNSLAHTGKIQSQETKTKRGISIKKTYETTDLRIKKSICSKDLWETVEYREIMNKARTGLKYNKVELKQLELCKRILSSTIDVSKVGWYKEMAKELDVSYSSIKNIIKARLPELWNTCFFDTKHKSWRKI